MSDYFVIMIILAVLTIIALIVMVAVIMRGVRERSRFSEEKAALTRSYEDAEDALQEKITALTGEKSALESRLAAMEEYEKRLQDEREKADKAMEEAREKAEQAQREAQEKALKSQAERYEKDLESMKDAFKALSAENSASFKVQSAAQIADLLKPIQEKFDAFDRSVRESQKVPLKAPP